jgi:hypothetical protein
MVPARTTLPGMVASTDRPEESNHARQSGCCIGSSRFLGRPACRGGRSVRRGRAARGPGRADLVQGWVVPGTLVVCRGSIWPGAGCHVSRMVWTPGDTRPGRGSHVRGLGRERPGHGSHVRGLGRQTSRTWLPCPRPRSLDVPDMARCPRPLSTDVPDMAPMSAASVARRPGHGPHVRGLGRRRPGMAASGAGRTRSRTRGGTRRRSTGGRRHA